MIIDKITPHFIDLTYNATLKSFWRKPALRSFLRHCRITENFLSTWSADETKRKFLERLFEILPRTDKGRQALLRMAKFLIEQSSFPDLENWEDSADKIKNAKAAVRQLKQYIHSQENEILDRKEKDDARKKHREFQEKIQRSKEDLQKLDSRFVELSKILGTQEAGYGFQGWFFDLLDYYDIVNRKPYKNNGREIDGSLTLSGTTYLVELKFTREQAGATDIDTFFKKVSSKADNTMGIMVSVSGYSSVAIKEASGSKTPLLLLDSQHLFIALSQTMALPEVIDRVRRHASQTGEAYLSADNFSGN